MRRHRPWVKVDFAKVSHRLGPQFLESIGKDEFDAVQANLQPPVPGNLKEIHTTVDQSVQAVEEYLAGMTEQQATGRWRLTLKGQEVFSKPRLGVLRSIMLNHWYHHRGQLSVYLRLLEVPVPVIYGRSADENPFA